MLITKLPNGPEVVLKENHFSGIVSIQCWVKAGSMHENEHQRGMAHVLEHMIFKGSKKRGPGEMASMIENCGGEVNAYTTFDRTVYYATMLSSHVAKGLDLLIEPLLYPSFDSGEFSAEKEVILEEIKRGNDNPASKMGYKLFEMCYPNSEVGRPVIGSEDSVKAFTRDDLVSFHHTWYQPENMVVVVAGDIDSEQVYKELSQIFEAWHPSEKGRSHTTTQLERRRFDSLPGIHFPKGIVTEVLKEDFQNLRLEIALPAPSLESFDAAMLDIAAFSLGGAESSRLVKALKVDNNLVASVASSTYTPCFNGMFTVTAVVPEENFLKVVNEIGAQLKSLLGEKPVSKSEIARAKASLEVDRIYRDETVEGQARTLGFGMQTAYKVSFDSMYNHQIELAEPSLIESSLQRWLDLSKAKIIALVPKGSSIEREKVQQAFEQGAGLARMQEDGGSTKPALLTPVQRPFVFPNRSKENKNTLDIVSTRLDCGLKFIYRRNRESKQFSINACAHGGQRYETAQNSGYYNVLAGMLGEKSAKFSRDTILEKVEGYGGGLSGFSGKDSVGLSLHCLGVQTQDLLPIFADCLLDPRFPQIQFDSLMLEVAQVMLAHEDSPSSKCMRRFASLVFPEGHPYSLPGYGLKETIASLSPEKLHDFFVKSVAPSRWVISCVASEPLEVISEQLNELFSGYSVVNSANKRAENGVIGGADDDTDLIKDIHTNTWIGKSEHLPMGREQTHLVMGYRGINWRSNKRAALDVLTNILGGHGGRLFTSLREKASLAYSVSPVVSLGVLDGAVGGYIACSPDKKDQATRMMREEFERVKETPVTKAELERAKNYLAGQHEMDMQKSDSQAMTMGLMELYGIGYDDFKAYREKVAKVGLDDVLGVARELFVSGGPLTISCGQ